MQWENIKVNFSSDDHSRVVLDQQDQLTGTDYINASYIDVSLHLDSVLMLKCQNTTGLWRD